MGRSREPGGPVRRSGASGSRGARRAEEAEVSEGYEVVHIDELEAFPIDDEGLTWRPIRRRFDIRAFGTNAYTAERAGQRVVEEHAERDNHQELYVVVQGRATFTFDGNEVDARSGTLVFCRPGTR